MRKFIIILAACVFFLIPAFAATSVKSDQENNTAEVEITFDLTDEENSTWEIGFASNVSNLKKNETVTPADSSITLDLIENQNHGGLNEKNLFVYWIIKGGQPLEITLGADGPLEGTYKDDEGSSSPEYMNWKVEWTPSVSGDGTVSGKSILGTTDSYTNEQPGVDYSAEPVFTREVLDTSREVDSAQLTITTQNIDGVKPANYAATLTLTIAPVETQ